MDITGATEHIKVILEREDTLSENVLGLVDDILEYIWHIDDVQIRTQIIQDAAIQLGLLRAGDIN